MKIMAIIYPDMYRNTGKDHSGMVNKPAYLNVNLPERLFSVAGGAILLYNGLKKVVHHPVTGAAQLLAGVTLLSRGVTGHCPVYEQVGTNSAQPESINIKHYFTVNKPRRLVYEFWRHFENLPLFMRHLDTVEQTDKVHSKWKARFADYLPAITWTAEIVKERENEFIGWQSTAGSIIENTGKVEFKDAPGGQGTEVQVVFSYHAPVGGIGTGIAKLFNPSIERIILEDVRNFKQYIEAGEVPTINGQPSGKA